MNAPTIDGSYISNITGQPNINGRYITFLEVPYPLPAIWVDTLKKAKSTAAINAAQKLIRINVGNSITRKFIHPYSYD